MTMIAIPSASVLPPVLVSGPPPVGAPVLAALPIGFAGLLAAALPVSPPPAPGAPAAETADAPPPGLAAQPASDAPLIDPGLPDAAYRPKRLTPSPAEIVDAAPSAAIADAGIARPGRAPDTGKPKLAVTGSTAGRRPLPRVLPAVDGEAPPAAGTQVPPVVALPPLATVPRQTSGVDLAAGGNIKAVAPLPIVAASRPQARTKAAPVKDPGAASQPPAPMPSPSPEGAAPKLRQKATEIAIPGETPAALPQPDAANVVPGAAIVAMPPLLDRAAGPAVPALAVADPEPVAAIPKTPASPVLQRSSRPVAPPIVAAATPLAPMVDSPTVVLPPAAARPAALVAAMPQPLPIPAALAPALVSDSGDRTEDGTLIAAAPMPVPIPNGGPPLPVRGVSPPRGAGDPAIDRSAAAPVAAAPPLPGKVDALNVAPPPVTTLSPLAARPDDQPDRHRQQPIGAPVDPVPDVLLRPAPPASPGELVAPSTGPLFVAQPGAGGAIAGNPAPRDPPAALALSVTSDQLGAVSIGVDDRAGDLRVRLSGSTAAAGAMTAEAPRLIAELAANGMRLGSLDIIDRADAPVAATAPGDGRNGQRAPSGGADPGLMAGSGFAGGAAADGQPANGGRAPPPMASIAAFARDNVARDQISHPRPTPSDRYA